MRIYVDMDDVLCHTSHTLVDVLEERFGRRVEIEEIVDFELKTSFDLSEPELAELLRIAHQPRWLDRIAPVDGAKQALEQLTRAGCEVAIVTGRPASAWDASQRWLRTHEMAHTHLEFLNKYGRQDWAESASSGPPTRTLEEVATMGFDFAVEDSFKMAIFLADQVGIPVALIDRPWNREAIPSRIADRVSRCRNWIEVLERFPPKA